MIKKLLFALLVSLLTLSSQLYAEDNYCYQKPDTCAAGDILILSLAEDVAKYCDFDKHIISIERHTRTSSSFNNEEVVCVKIASPRSKLK